MRQRRHTFGPVFSFVFWMSLLALPAHPAHAQVIASRRADDTAPAANAPEVLTNRDVVDLTRAGVEPAVIVSTIESSRTRFTVAVNDIVTLSNERVNAAAIAAMQASVARSGQPRAGMGPAATAVAGLPIEHGMYVVEDGESSRLPQVDMSVESTWTDSRGRNIHRVEIPEYRTVQRKEVESDAPTFLLFHPGGQMPRIRMYHLTGSGMSRASLDEEVSLHTEPAGPDPRIIKLTPGMPLDRGSYIFVVGENFRRAYGFGRVRGTLNPPSLAPREALILVRRRPAIQTSLPPADAKTAVLGVLARERIAVEQDFDANGVLITMRALHGGPYASRAAVQFSVQVQPFGTGSEIRVAADAYTAGNVEGMLTGEDLADIPLVPAPDQGRRYAEGILRDIQRAVRRAR
jgi:hypothetical protein